MRGGARVRGDGERYGGGQGRGKAGQCKVVGKGEAVENSKVVVGMAGVAGVG